VRPSRAEVQGRATLRCRSASEVLSPSTRAAAGLLTACYGAAHLELTTCKSARREGDLLVLWLADVVLLYYIQRVDDAR